MCPDSLPKHLMLQIWREINACILMQENIQFQGKGIEGSCPRETHFKFRK